MYGGYIYGGSVYGGTMFVVRAGTFVKIQLKITDGVLSTLNKEASLEEFHIEGGISLFREDASLDRLNLDADIGHVFLDASSE